MLFSLVGIAMKLVGSLPAASPVYDVSKLALWARYGLGQPSHRGGARRMLGRIWAVGAVSGGRAWPHDASLVGEDDYLHAVAQAELGEDAGDVAFHGCLTEVELCGDLGI